MARGKVSHASNRAATLLNATALTLWQRFEPPSAYWLVAYVVYWLVAYVALLFNPLLWLVWQAGPDNFNLAMANSCLVVLYRRP